MDFKTRYPEYASVEEHVRHAHARTQRSTSRTCSPASIAAAVRGLKGFGSSFRATPRRRRDEQRPASRPLPQARRPRATDSNRASRRGPGTATTRRRGRPAITSLHYTDWGRRNRTRAIICAHGYSGNARDFDALAAALAPDARVICIDVAGRGDSDWLALAARIPLPPVPLRHQRAHRPPRRARGRLGRHLDGRAAGPACSPRSLPAPVAPPRDERHRRLRAAGRAAGHRHQPRCARPLRRRSKTVEAHLRHTHREWGEITDEQWKAMAVHGSRPRTDTGFRLAYDPQHRAA